MKKSILNIFFLLLTGLLFAQEVDLLFEKANESYREGNYKEALANYHAIDSLGVQSADLYYNLGNSYYKLNQIAPSIYYFEKALQIDANHKDAKHNLIFAQRMTIDAFEEVPMSFFQKFNQKVIYPIPYNKWAWISIVFAFLIAFFFLMYYFSRYSGKKRLFFTASILSVFLFLVTVSFTIKAKHYTSKNQPAIIFNSKVSVKAEPTLKSSEVFELHEGTKVQVLEHMDTWYKIKIADGKIGWVLQSSLKKIKG